VIKDLSANFPPGTQMIVQSQLNPAPDLHIIHLKQYQCFSLKYLFRCTSLS